MSAWRALLQAEAKVFLRDKASLIFTLLFPLLFIIIFGSLMTDFGGSDDTSVGLVSLAGSDPAPVIETLESLGAGQNTMVKDQLALETAIENRQVDLGILWDSSRLTFLYNAHRTQENFAFEALARGVASRIDLTSQGVEPSLAVTSHVVGGRPDAGWFALVVPGILAFSILSAGLFAIAGHLTSMKERRLLARYLVTPMRPTALLGAIATVRLVVVFVSTLITLGVAMGMFRIDYTIDWPRYVLFVIASTFGTMGLGTGIALVVRRASSASNLVSGLSISMMFVSGIYFPIEIMPSFLRAISMATPLRHMADALRFLCGVMDMPDLRFWAITAAFLAVGLISLPLLGRYVVRADRR